MTEPVRHEIEVRRDVRVPTGEPGITLAADLYRPVTTDPVPALVTLLPYRRDLIGGQQYDAAMRYFAAHGYACLLADLRGTGSSDGDLRPRLHPGEGDDAEAVIAWAAGAPWCTGAVGMWGLSYAAAMTLRAAGRRPPALKAIIPVAGKPDPERYDGMRGDGLLTGWGAQSLTLQLLPSLLDPYGPAERRRWRHRIHAVDPVLLDLVRHGRGDPEWRERTIDVGAITVPTLCVGGWRDAFPDSIVALYEAVNGPKKLLMGPWMHSFPHTSPLEPLDFLAIARRWWDHWLRGHDTGVMDEPAVTCYVLGDRPGWRGYPSWPPAKDELTLATAAGRELVAAADAGPAPAAAIGEYRPDPTIGTSGGLGGESPHIGLPLDQHDDDARSLTATGTPLPGGVLIAGSPEVTLTPEPGGPPIQRLVVRLCDVDADGRSTLITYGRHLPAAGGGAERVVLRPVLYRLPPGHRLRVAVSDSDVPCLTPLPRPTPIRPARIALSVPTADDEAGAPVAVPALAPGTTELNERWTITRDPVHQGVEVTTGLAAGGRPPGLPHHVERDSATRVAVRRDAPEAATTTGHSTVTVRLAEGGTISVTTRVRCTQTHMTVHGEITEDGTVTYSRTWEAPLGSGEEEGTRP